MCCKRRISCCVILKSFIILIIGSLVYVAYNKSSWMDAISERTSSPTKNVKIKSSFTAFHGPSFSLDKVKPAKLLSEKKQVLIKNPLALLTTSIPDNVPGHDIEKAYAKKDAFFWGKTVKAEDYVELIFVKATHLRRIVFSSGKAGHEGDTFLDTSLLISRTYINKCDFQEIKQFHDSPIVDYEFEGTAPLVHCVRLVINKIRIGNHGRPRWLIVRDISVN